MISKMKAPIPSPTTHQPRLWHWLALALVLGITLVVLRFEGHWWWCRCGGLFPWSGDIHSEHNSQHLVDPYSFAHVLHGLLFYALLRPLARRFDWATRLVLALSLESFWEVFENSPMVIERYRQTTIAQGYFGDTVVNSFGDIASCLLGFILASRLPVRWSIALFLGVELTLLVLYRDNLALNVLMLLYPVEGVKSWQMGASH